MRFEAMTIKSLRLICVLSLPFLAGCGGVGSGNCAAPSNTIGTHEAAPTANDAIAAADAFLATVPLRRYGPPSVIDMRDRWRLLYDGGGGTGGPILVVVNKRSGEVVHYETEQ